MNTAHLGDAYDLAKKVILETLKEGLEMTKDGLKMKEEGLKMKVYVLPMFTDTFNEEKLAFYRNLTSCDEIKTEEIPTETEDRTRYFKTKESDGIIFVDPNTGIKQISGLKSKEKVNFISFDELRTISEQCDLLVVYDQSFSHDSPPKKKTGIERKIDTIQKRDTMQGKNGPYYCFYLNLGSLAFAFISKNNDLLQQAKALLIKRKVALPERIVE